jgi:Protein of unknown function (DUF2892)
VVVRSGAAPDQVPFFNKLEMNMQANVGGMDRAVRIGAGVVLLGLAATGTVGSWGWIGVVPILTGLAGWCPAYLPFGLSTCKMK